jgi:hypothetical protein
MYGLKAVPFKELLFQQTLKSSSPCESRGLPPNTEWRSAASFLVFTQSLQPRIHRQKRSWV